MSRFWKEAPLKIKRKDAPLTLSTAMVCVDCEHIYSAYNPNGTCPKCGSEAVMPISRWIPARPVLHVQGVA